MNLDLNTRANRRQAIKTGGLTVTLAALVAACGDNRGGDDAPGRVGNAPVITTPPDYTIDDVVLLRTASSLELTAVEIYETALSLDGAIPADMVPMVDRLIEDHLGVAERMAALTESAGGEAWSCTNPWLMERLVAPTLELILSDIVGIVALDEDGSTKVQVLGELPEIAETIMTLQGEITATSSIDGLDIGDEITFSRLDGAVSDDVMALIQAVESLAAASHQELVSATSITEARIAHLEAATLEARHAATLAIAIYGAAGYISPSLIGDDDPPTERGQIRHFAVESTFGQTAQIEVKSGPGDSNAVRTSVVLQTPAANTLVYSELSCDA